jgi:hypothetical protein
MNPCTNISAVNIYTAPADTGIATGITAPVSGDYRILIEFNGTYQLQVLTMTENAEIVLPPVLNGDYDHMTQIFKPDGTLLNGTCYLLCVRSIAGSGNGLPPSPSANARICSLTVQIVATPDTSLTYTLCNGQTIQLQYAPGDTLTILDMNGQPFLMNKSVNLPFFLNGGVVQQPNWNSATGVWDNTANGGFNGSNTDPSIITIEYAQPID